MRTRSILAVVVVIGALLAFAGAAVLVSAGVQPGGEFSASPSMSVSASSGRMVVPDRQKSLSSAGPAQGHTAPAATIMTQNFEGSWPASGWQLLDESSQDGGEYLFGKRNCHPRTGSYAGWSVGGGAQGGALACSANFPDEADTSAIYGPFDLTGATSAQLIFYLWGRVQVSAECENAEFFVASSVDNRRYAGNTYCGDYTNGPDGNGYYRLTLDLNQRLGQSQVWVAFNFASSESGPDIGFTIDDVRLEVGTAPTATPTATSTPTVEDTPTPTATPTAEDTPTATATPTMEDTPTPTATSSAGDTPTPTATSVVGDTPTPTATSVVEGTPTPTATSVSAYTPTPTGTPSAQRRIWLPLILRDYPAATPERPR